MTHRNVWLILAEVLGVLAFVALLFIFVEPLIGHPSREQARMAQCSNNQRQIALAVIDYAQDNEETLPSAGSVWTDIKLFDTPPSAGSPSVLRCPDAMKLPNGYIYNNRLSGKKLNDPTLGDHTRCMVTADGQHRNPTSSESRNIAYSAADLNYRHLFGEKLLASFLDGHTDLADASQTAAWFSPPAK